MTRDETLALVEGFNALLDVLKDFCILNELDFLVTAKVGAFTAFDYRGNIPTLIGLTKASEMVLTEKLSQMFKNPSGLQILPTPDEEWEN